MSDGADEYDPEKGTSSKAPLPPPPAPPPLNAEKPKPAAEVEVPVKIPGVDTTGMSPAKVRMLAMLHKKAMANLDKNKE